MAEPIFLRQTDTPLFPKVLWNRPVSSIGAGRLLIIGGHTGAFSLPQGIYQLAEAAGIGEVQVLLPDSLRPLLAPLGIGLFAPSTGSGSLSKKALGEILNIAQNYDTSLIGPSLSNHSEVTVLVEALLAKHPGQIVVVEDALIAARHNPALLTTREDCLVILSMEEAFKLAGSLELAISIRPDRGVLNKIEIMQALARAGTCAFVLYGPELIVTSSEKVSMTPLPLYNAGFLPAIYSVCSTFWTQNPTNRFEGLTTAAYVLSQALGNESSSLNDQAKDISEVLEESDW